MVRSRGREESVSRRMGGEHVQCCHLLLLTSGRTRTEKSSLDLWTKKSLVKLAGSLSLGWQEQKPNYRYITLHGKRE